MKSRAIKILFGKNVWYWNFITCIQRKWIIEDANALKETKNYICPDFSIRYLVCNPLIDSFSDLISTFVILTIFSIKHNGYEKHLYQQDKKISFKRNHRAVDMVAKRWTLLIPEQRETRYFAINLKVKFRNVRAGSFQVQTDDAKVRHGGASKFSRFDEPRCSRWSVD